MKIKLELLNEDMRKDIVEILKNKIIKEAEVIVAAVKEDTEFNKKMRDQLSVIGWHLIRCDQGNGYGAPPYIYEKGEVLSNLLSTINLLKIPAEIMLDDLEYEFIFGVEGGE